MATAGRMLGKTVFSRKASVLESTRWAVDQIWIALSVWGRILPGWTRKVQSAKCNLTHVSLSPRGDRLDRETLDPQNADTGQVTPALSK